MTEYTIYKVKLDCQHVSDWEDRRPPQRDDEGYCPKCKAFGRVVAVYAVTRNIEDVEEMLE